MEAILNDPRWNPRSSSAARERCSRETKARSTSSKKNRASGVGWRRRRRRSNIATPTVLSKSASRRLTAGWETHRISAAPLVVPLIITARNASIWR